jgi:hypothetical protein
VLFVLFVFVFVRLLASPPGVEYVNQFRPTFNDNSEPILSIF